MFSVYVSAFPSISLERWHWKCQYCQTYGGRCMHRGCPWGPQPGTVTLRSTPSCPLPAWFLLQRGSERECSSEKQDCNSITIRMNVFDFSVLNFSPRLSENKAIKYFNLKAADFSFTSWPHLLTLFLFLSLITSEKLPSFLFHLRILGHPWDETEDLPVLGLMIFLQRQGKNSRRGRRNKSDQDMVPSPEKKNNHLAGELDPYIISMPGHKWLNSRTPRTLWGPMEGPLTQKRRWGKVVEDKSQAPEKVPLGWVAQDK